MNRRTLLVKIARTALACVLFAGTAASAIDAGASPHTRVAVIYPQVREPYRSVFRDIVKGMESALPGSIADLEVQPERTAQQLSADLRAQQVGAVVLLGKHGLNLSGALDPSLQRVVGAVLAGPDEVPPAVRATSLAPSPRKLFEKLHELAPGVRTIHVIYGADGNDWLIAHAREAADALGYRFDAIRKDNIKEGANAYRTLLTQSGPTDAVWLLQASAFLEESSVLQMILRTAWDRNVVVFSSNGSHVPKGALFALFPDNAAMGAHLARLAAGDPAQAPGLQPLEQLNTAINIRTADHLGLGLNAGDSRFNMVFPSR